MIFVLPLVHTLKAAWDEEARALGKPLRWVALGHRVGASLFSEAHPDYFAECRFDESVGKLEPFGLALKWRREGRPAAVIVLGQSARLALAAWFARVPIRAGIADNRMAGLYTDSCTYRLKLRHLADRLGTLAEALRVDAPRFRQIGARELGGLRGVEKLRRAGWDGSERLVALAPGTRGDFKRWKPERAKWPALAELMAAKGFRPVLLGTEEERGLAHAIRAAVPAAIDLTGQTSIPEAAAVLEVAGVAVAVDTGLSHLASLVGCATVTLFGPSHERWAQPVGPWSLSLRGDALPTAPGELRAGDGNDSLQRLEPRRVAQVLLALVEERSQARPQPEVVGPIDR
ncbi:MAG: glycosyltransferase family 9 protein [Acidobacteria bacterium]|nr:glycosyltransferase family 9 protein [Acidobacteriota bacterium]